MHTLQSVQKVTASLHKELCELQTTVTERDASLRTCSNEIAVLAAELDYERQRHATAEKQLREHIALLEKRLSSTRQLNPAFRKVEEGCREQLASVDSLHQDLLKHVGLFFKAQDAKLRDTQTCLSELTATRLAEADTRLQEMLTAREAYYQQLYSSKPWSEIKELRSNVAKLETFNRKLLEENAGLRASLKGLRVETQVSATTRNRHHRQVSQSSQTPREPRSCEKTQSARGAMRRSASFKPAMRKQPRLLNALAFLAKTSREPFH